MKASIPPNHSHSTPSLGSRPTTKDNDTVKIPKTTGKEDSYYVLNTNGL